MKAIHVTEMQELVAKQLENGESLDSVEPFLPKIIRPFSFRFYGCPSMNFRLQPTFLKVLTQIENCDETKEIFSYSEILNMFSRYVVERRHTLIDPRNPKVLL